MMQNKTLITAFVLTALTACSNNDMVGENKPTVNQSMQDIKVESLMYEDESGTRSAYDVSTNQLYWQQGERIGVYEKNLYDCDIYTFQASQRAFVPMDGASNISTSAAYALYPYDMVYMPGWTTKGVKAIMQLPSVVVYNAKSEDASTASGKNLYKGDLPMWGLATGEFGNMSLNMKYLSAVMKLTLKGVKDKATYVKVSSESKPLSGGLEIVVADKKGVVNENCQLQEGTSALSTNNYIIVDLRSVPKSDAIVFLPIVPGEYNDLTVSYTDGDLSYDEEGVLEEESIGNVEWKLIKEYTKGKQMKRGSGYSVTAQF